MATNAHRLVTTYDDYKKKILLIFFFQYHIKSSMNISIIDQLNIFKESIKQIEHNKQLFLKLLCFI